MLKKIILDAHDEDTKERKVKEQDESTLFIQYYAQSTSNERIYI